MLLSRLLCLCRKVDESVTICVFIFLLTKRILPALMITCSCSSHIYCSFVYIHLLYVLVVSMIAANCLNGDLLTLFVVHCIPLTFHLLIPLAPWQTIAVYTAGEKLDGEKSKCCQGVNWWIIMTSTCTLYIWRCQSILIWMSSYWKMPNFCILIIELSRIKSLNPWILILITVSLNTLYVCGISLDYYHHNIHISF